MFLRSALTTLIILTQFLFLEAQSRYSTRKASLSYIAKYKDIATELSEKFGIPASVILAQAMFESGCGQSELAKRSNNHFGIKCHRGWTGDTVRKTDDSYNECFRKYEAVEQSYADHSLFLKTRVRYAHLFNLPKTDYEGWCKGLKKAGYATFPMYAEELIRLIESYDLYLLDCADKLPPQPITASTAEIRKSHVPAEYIALKHMAETDLLFSSECDYVLKSFLVLGPDMSSSRTMASK